MQLIYKYILVFLFSGLFAYCALFVWKNDTMTIYPAPVPASSADSFSSPPNPGDVALKTLEAMKKQYLRPDGMIQSRTNGTVSESQSYMMLIAVYSEDREMFDQVWNWTKDNLQRKDDALFSWLWENGHVADMNPATDADQDIAYALYLAYKKWGDEKHLVEAREIVRDIWRVETKEIGDVRYVAGGNWAVDFRDGVVVNPSYLDPYQYRVFADFDAEHDWISLVDSSYKALELCTGSAGLAMNWCKIDNKGNVVRDYKFSGKDSTVYSYDALRVPYRIAMDYLLNKDPRALAYLKKNTAFAQDWKNKGKIFAVYNQKGERMNENESLASYGAQLASMSLTDMTIAKEIFEKKIATISSWENIGFYDMSWLWFGLQFYANELTLNYETP